MPKQASLIYSQVVVVQLRGESQSPEKHLGRQQNLGASMSHPLCSASELEHTITTIGGFAMEGNARFDRWQEACNGLKMCTSRSEELMTVDTPPAQTKEAD